MVELKKELTGALRLILLGVLLLSIAGLFGSLGRDLDILSHGRAHYTLVSLICLIGFGFLRDRGMAIISAGMLVFNLFFIAPYYLNFSLRADDETGLQKIRILHLNVLKTNNRYDDVKALIQQYNPDILSLQEIDTRWVNTLQETLSTYPSQKTVPLDNNFGIGLYSKIPMDTIEVKYYGDPYDGRHFPSLLGRSADGSFSILASHPLTPMSGFYIRNTQYRDMGRQRSKMGKNLIFVGDLNSTPWSPYFQRLLQDMQLRDSQLGFGVQPTWPAFYPILFVPIDHVLVSEDIRVLRRETGPDVGSDHLPVYVELGLPES